MESSAPSCNRPDTLDLHAWLEYALLSSDSCARALALEEIAEGNLTATFHDRLRACADSDPDVDCRERAADLLARDARQAEAQTLAAGFEATPRSLRALFDQAPIALRQALRSVIRGVPEPALLDLWRDTLLTEPEPEVAAVGLNLLARAGAASDAALGVALLSSEHAIVVTAAIDLLVALNQPGLSTHLRLSLHHPLPEVRFHAVRHLIDIDPESALRALNEAVTDDDPFIRRRALQELRRLPRELTEASFVQVIGYETQPLLLIIAGLFLAEHPNPAIPPHIYDHLLMSQGVKKHVLNLILRQVVQGIRATGNLDRPIDEYLADLKRELAGRRDDLTIALIMRDLRHPSLDVRRLALERCRSYAAETRMQKALRGRERHETDPALRREIQALLEAAPDTTAAPETADKTGSAVGPSSDGPDQALRASPAPSPETPPSDFVESVATGAFFQQTPKRQITQLGTLSDADRFRASRAALLRILQTSNEKSVLLRVTKLFERWGSRTDADVLLPLLKRGDPALLGQALKTLAHLEYEGIATLLNPFLRDENLAVKAAALEAFMLCDREGAIQYLKSMLGSPTPAVRRKGLSLAPLVDFPVVEAALIAILQSDPIVDLQMQAGLLLASNPNDRGLKALYRRTHRVGTEVPSDLAELWNSVRSTAALRFQKPVEEIDAWLGDLVAREDRARERRLSVARSTSVPRSATTPEPSISIPLKSWLFSGEMASFVGIFALFFLAFQISAARTGTEVSPYRRDPAPTPVTAAVRSDQTHSGTHAPAGPAAATSISTTPKTPFQKSARGWITLPATWTGTLR